MEGWEGGDRQVRNGSRPAIMKIWQMSANNRKNWRSEPYCKRRKRPSRFLLIKSKLSNYFFCRDNSTFLIVLHISNWFYFILIYLLKLALLLGFITTWQYHLYHWSPTFFLLADHVVNVRPRSNRYSKFLGTFFTIIKNISARLSGAQTSSFHENMCFDCLLTLSLYVLKLKSRVHYCTVSV